MLCNNTFKLTTINSLGKLVMYIVEIYEEDYSDTHGEILVYVGKFKGKFLTERDARVKIDHQDNWNKRNFFFKVVKED